MSSKGKKSWFEAMADDAVDTITGLFSGDVDDGPPERKSRNGRRDDTDDDGAGDDDSAADDESDDDEDDVDDEAPPRKAKKGPAIDVERVFNGPRRGRPPGSATKKKAQQSAAK